MHMEINMNKSPPNPRRTPEELADQDEVWGLLYPALAASVARDLAAKIIAIAYAEADKARALPAPITPADRAAAIEEADRPALAVGIAAVNAAIGAAALDANEIVVKVRDVPGLNERVARRVMAHFRATWPGAEVNGYGESLHIVLRERKREHHFPER